ncbi:alpha/beta hydrolase family protein [Mycobacterium yunnanensis]|uniref:alpha/beta hydrolase family protein n=1 Tax=Mycobacterium yunnanensis TaxID=368477 RepID=UPI0021F3303E|nr:alpha/beta hydrolase family protein [Mycobacterium yunnanensis]
MTKLPLVNTWQGTGGDAARASLDELSAYLAAHGEEMNELSSATRESADDIDRIKASLAAIDADARREGFSIDPASGAVTPLHTDMVGDPIYALQQADLETRIHQLLHAANTADAELARAISGATADAAGRPDDPRVRDALTKPLPEDPQQFHDLWEALTSEQKDALYQRDHSIGNHDGMPAVDRDYYNRLTLADQLAAAKTAQAHADALKNQHPDWAAGREPNVRMPGNYAANKAAYAAWKEKYDAATAGAKNLSDLQAVDKSVGDFPDRKLMLLDTTSGEMAHAAVAIGDPDTASHVSVTAPGLNTTVHGSIGSMTEEAANLQRETYRQLGNSPGHELESVSTIAWIGYDAPQIPGWDEKAASLAGAWGVSHDDMAKVGAHHLAGFYDGIKASHEGVPADVTAIGHSYGSLTTGLALQEPGNHGITDAIFYGSPGIEATTPGQLQLPEGHVFTMETPDDPIQAVYDSKPWLHGLGALPPPFGPLAATVVGGMDLTGAGDFGPNPATNPNFTHLETGATAVPNGQGGTMSLGGASGHSDYPRFMDDGTPRTTNYNIAAIIAGLDDNAVRQK